MDSRRKCNVCPVKRREIRHVSLTFNGSPALGPWCKVLNHYLSRFQSTKQYCRLEIPNQKIRLWFHLKHQANWDWYIRQRTGNLTLNNMNFRLLRAILAWQLSVWRKIHQDNEPLFPFWGPGLTNSFVVERAILGGMS